MSLFLISYVDLGFLYPYHPLCITDHDKERFMIFASKVRNLAMHIAMQTFLCNQNRSKELIDSIPKSGWQKKRETFLGMNVF